MESPIIENGVVVGTAGKFEQENPFVQWAIRNFDRVILDLVRPLDPRQILEVGCGEGHVTGLLLRHTEARIVAYDISDPILEIAREAAGAGRAKFARKCILDLKASEDSAPLVVCCEVLEHLEDPERGLRRLAEVAAPYALVSVPREPLFQTLNFLRGAHLRALGNSPGHLHHWGTKDFVRLVQRYFEILEVRTPLPWTIVLGCSRPGK